MILKSSSWNWNLKDRSQQIVLAEVQIKTSKNTVTDRERQLKLLNLQIKTSLNNVKDRERQVILSELQLQTSKNNLRDRQRQVKLAETQNRSLEELSLADMQSVEPGITKDVFSILNIEIALNARNSFGATAPKNVTKACAQARLKYLK